MRVICGEVSNLVLICYYCLFVVGINGMGVDLVFFSELVLKFVEIDCGYLWLKME